MSDDARWYNTFTRADDRQEFTAHEASILPREGVAGSVTSSAHHPSDYDVTLTLTMSNGDQMSTTATLTRQELQDLHDTLDQALYGEDET